MKLQDEQGFEPKTFWILLLPLSHWADGSEAPDKLHIAALCGASAELQLTLSLYLEFGRGLHTMLLYAVPLPWAQWLSGKH